eukprot:618879-Rhodomonas_salina.2
MLVPDSQTSASRSRSVTASAPRSTLSAASGLPASRIAYPSRQAATVIPCAKVLPPSADSARLCNSMSPSSRPHILATSSSAFNSLNCRLPPAGGPAVLSRTSPDVRPSSRADANRASTSKRGCPCSLDKRASTRSPRPVSSSSPAPSNS